MKFLNDIDLSGMSKIVNLPVPTAETDLVTKGFVEDAVSRAIAGFDFQKDVLAKQDAEFAPNPAEFKTGDRYIIGDAAGINAAFGTIENVGQGDIVEYDGSKFVVVYDVSEKGDGILVYSHREQSYFKYVAGEWSFGGLTQIIAGLGLENLEGTFSVKLDQTTIGVNGGGSLELKDESVGLDKIALGLTGLGLQQGVDKKIAIKLNDDRLAVDADGIKIIEQFTKKVTADLGDGTATEFSVPHDLGTRDVMVQVVEKSTYATVEADVERTGDNNVTVKFAVAPTAGQYRAIIIG
jgi:hypothetical protein